MSRPDWKQVWEEILEEDSAGDPKPYKGYRRSSGNRIHQAYHLARFQEETGLPVSRFPLIVEFGGGYGSLCRLVHKLGFKGQYIIFDLPEFVALQKFYLGSLAMPLIEAKDVSSGRRGILCTSDLSVLGSVTTPGSANRPLHRHVVAQRNGSGLPGASRRAARRRRRCRLSHRLPARFRGSRQPPVLRCVAREETDRSLDAQRDFPHAGEFLSLRPEGGLLKPALNAQAVRKTHES